MEKGRILEQVVAEWKEKIEDLGFYYYGIRFENAEREIGDVLHFESKDDSEREDTRDFPEYDSEEYDELPDMGGVSSWNLEDFEDFKDWRGEYVKSYLGNHCYIIAGDDGHQGYADVTCDEGEVVIENPTVLAKIW